MEKMNKLDSRLDRIETLLNQMFIYQSSTNGGEDSPYKISGRNSPVPGVVVKYSDNEEFSPPLRKVRFPQEEEEDDSDTLRAYILPLPRNQLNSYWKRQILLAQAETK